jgi:hypothetical protein
MPSPTDPAVIERIRELAPTGMSARAIAAEIGKTRSAVIGLCHRHGIKIAGSPTQTPRKPRACEPRAEDQAAPPPPRPVNREGPGPHGCRWPLWGDRQAPTHRYCEAEPAGEGKPYCAKHTDRARDTRSGGSPFPNATSWR